MFCSATLEQKITDLDALMRGASHGRLSCLRERDRLSAVKRNLDVETRRITGQNKSDKDFVDKMLRQVSILMTNEIHKFIPLETDKVVIQ